jgi:hypothetical protein
MDGLEQIKAIQKLEELLTKTPVQEEQPAQTEPEPRATFKTPVQEEQPAQTEPEPRVTFEPTVKPPAPSPRMKIIQPEAARTIQMNKKTMSVSDATIKKAIQKASNKHTERVPLARVLARNQRLTLNSQQILGERAQLIHDKETSKYLNYRQLLRDPKHAKLWAHSAANKFGQLAQGVGTRIKGTNTIHFIRKNQVPQKNKRCNVWKFQLQL